MMAGDRAHFPQPGEVRRTLERMAAEHQTLCGWLETMTDEELHDSMLEIRRMIVIVANEVLRRAARGLDDE